MSTTAVQLTGPGVSAIAVILLSGDRAQEILRALAPRCAQLLPGQVLHAALHHPTSHEKIDDAVLIRTAQSAYELHIHGGLAVAAAVRDALQSAGATIITLEEARALGHFGAGITGELALALPRAKTLTAARLLAAQTDAGLAAWSLHWQSWLTEKKPSPDNLWPLHSAAQWLLARSRTLAQLLDPPRIAIIGPPNAGKSTLANALLGRPASITSATAGTTRDWVDAPAIFIAADIHIPVILIDTAGIRETADTLEQQSITRTHHQAAAAAAIILLFDATQPPTAEIRALLHRYAAQRISLILAANKIDLLPTSQISNPEAQISNFKSQISNLPSALPVSAKTPTGLNALMAAVLHHLDLAQISPTEPFAFTQRQRNILQTIALTNKTSAIQRLLDSIHNA